MPWHGTHPVPRSDLFCTANPREGRTPSRVSTLWPSPPDVGCPPALGSASWRNWNWCRYPQISKHERCLKMGNNGKPSGTMWKQWENMGKQWENNGKTMGKRGKTVINWSTINFSGHQIFFKQTKFTCLCGCSPGSWLHPLWRAWDSVAG